MTRISKILLLSLAMGLAACGGPAGPEVVGGGPYIPNFTFQWRNKADFTNTYAFLTDTAGVSSGTFTGGSNERLGGAFNPLTGTFKDRNLALKVQRTTGGVTATVDVTGRFLTDDTIELRWGSTVITIERFGS